MRQSNEQIDGRGKPRGQAAIQALSWVGSVVALGLYGAGLLLESSSFLVAAVLTIGGTASTWTIRRFRTAYIFAAFLACFMLFLVGRFAIVPIVGVGNRPVLGLYGSNFDEEATIRHILSCLFIGIVFLFIGALWASSMKSSVKTSSNSTFWTMYRIKALRKFGLIIFYCALPFQIMLLLDVAEFVQTEGFYEYRMTFDSSLPAFVGLIAGFFDVGLFAFLSTRPNKRSSLLPLFLYLAVGAVSLLTWQRSGFILNVLIVVVYVCYRHVTRENSERWITRRLVWITAVVLLPVMIGMSAINQLRGRTSDSSLPGFGVLDFLYDQGVSMNVIGYAYEFKDQIPDQKFYSFGPIIEFVNLRILSLVTNVDMHSGQSAERALEGHQFAHMVSFLAIPDVYLRGSGYGSSYVAELFVDFGYIGVAVGSLLYGFVLVGASKWLSHGITVRLLVLLVVRDIMFTPRASYVQFLVSPFEAANLLAFAMLAFLVVFVPAGRPGTSRNLMKARQ